MSAIQDNRTFTITSVLGANKLLFMSLQAKEELSQCFEYEIELLSENKAINPADVLGSELTLTVKFGNEKSREFTGRVAEFSLEGEDGRFGYYRALLVPWLWMLTRATNCRIFQQMTVPDIVKKVLGEYGFSGDLVSSTQETYRTREYCVQYRESDFDFINRLLEEEGIYYYFSHANGRHKLNLMDATSSHQASSDYATIQYYPPAPDNAARRTDDHIWSWQSKRQVQSHKMSLTDFDFTKPNTSLLVNLNNNKPGTQAAYEQYDYPGGYTATADGNHYVKARLQSAQCGYERYSGEGNVFALPVGSLFTLAGYPRDDLNMDYLLTGVSLRLQSNDFISGASTSEVIDESIQISAIPKAATFKAAQTTPKPVVRGPQTAIVVGMAGEEIMTDQYGRVKVHFHWDRLGRTDENSSCWIRVSYPWAGKGWGAIAIPRIGQEVIVDFLEGDPDQPIITGRVYNADQTVPYALPGNATQSGIKSRSSKGGGVENFNELRFEDKKGSEEVYIHAEKDMNVVIENNETRKVGFDKKDKGNQTIDIYNDRTTTLDQGNDKLQIKTGNRDVIVDKGNLTTKVSKGNRTTTISEGSDKLQVAKGDRDVLVDQGNHTLKLAKGNRLTQLDTGGDKLIIKAGDQEIKLDSGAYKLTLTAGNQTTKLSAGSSSTEAGTSIELKVGANSIKIDQSGVTIKGIKVKIEGDAMAELKAAITKIDGSAMLMAKGGIVMIN